MLPTHGCHPENTASSNTATHGWLVNNHTPAVPLVMLAWLAPSAAPPQPRRPRQLRQQPAASSQQWPRHRGDTIVQRHRPRAHLGAAPSSTAYYSASRHRCPRVSVCSSLGLRGTRTRRAHPASGSHTAHARSVPSLQAQQPALRASAALPASCNHVRWDPPGTTRAQRSSTRDSGERAEWLRPMIGTNNDGVRSDAVHAGGRARRTQSSGGQSSGGRRRRRRHVHGVVLVVGVVVVVVDLNKL